MPCCQKEETSCESLIGPTSDGYCADGRSCDEVCIAVIAAKECKDADHIGIDDQGCSDSICQGNTEDSCCQSKQYTSTKKLSQSRPNSCCTDNRNDCALDSTLGHCRDGGERSQADPPVPSKTAKDTSCKPNGDRSTAMEQCENLRSSDCCRKITATDEQISKSSQKMDISCDVEASSSATSAQLSEDVEELQEACSLHLTAAMKKYRAYLEAGICICRKALKQPDVCCSQPSQVAVSRKRKISFPTMSCCAGTSASLKPRKHDSTRASNGKTFCSTPRPTTKGAEVCSALRNECCSNQKTGRRTNNGIGTVCEKVVDNRASSVKSSADFSIVNVSQDLERDAGREHVMFHVTGMTCTGCVKKVQGVLHKLAGVENVQLNFVAATGGMDVDVAKMSATTVLRRLEKETGFKCSRIVSDYHILDLNMVSAAARSFGAALPKGVESIERVGKDVYHVSYDPYLIGARTVLASSGGRVAPPSNDKAVSEGRRQGRLMLLSFLGATMFTVPVCVLAFSDVTVPFLTKGIIELVLATAVQLIAVSEFYIPALKALIFSKTIEMDMLVVISITAAYSYSVVAFGLQISGIYLEQEAIFETSTLLITLVLLGRLVASYAKIKAVQAVSLKSLQAETALLEDAEGEVIQIDARLLEFNDVIRIPAHSKIVSDGQIVSGESAVDESMVTGESLPIHKAAGDSIIAGTVNGSGVLRAKLTRLPGKNSITDIADLVQNALQSKPRVQDLADIVAGYFVPVVVSISIIVFAIWIAVALRIRKHNAGGAIGTAITYTIAVLAISCPCGIGLAVPLVLVIAGGVAARSGVIIKQGNATERGFKVTDIVFDKTGTLTTGELEVTQQLAYEHDISADVVLGIAYSLVKDDMHPVAQAVAAKLKPQNVLQEKLEAVETVPGCGIKAVWNGQEARAGSAYWLSVNTDPSVTALQAEGYTLLCLTLNQRLVASFGLKATIRPEAQSVISTLQKRGLICHIVSGDQPTAVSNVATSLGIPIDNTLSRQTPGDKQTYIEQLKLAGKTTLFVGDGTNDAVAIAAANIGVQIGAASDVTRATADVVLLGGLDGIITLLDVSKQSFYRIFFNFVWSAVYNVFAILLASGAFVKVRIAPNYAGLGEIVSVLPVVFVALTMLSFKPRSYR